MAPAAIAIVAIAPHGTPRSRRRPGGATPGGGRSSAGGPEVALDDPLGAAPAAALGSLYYQFLVRGCGFDDPEARARTREAFETAWRGMLA